MHARNDQISHKDLYLHNQCVCEQVLVDDHNRYHGKAVGIHNGIIDKKMALLAMNILSC